MENDRKKLLNMTAETVGKDLLSALVQEIKLLPNTWPKMSENRQNDLIDRLRKRVETNVKMAVHIIASNNQTVVDGELDSIAIKDGAKAVIKVNQNHPNFLGLCGAQGKAVLVTVAGSGEFTGGMDEVRGESDQRAMNLGEEYKPDSDGEGMDDGGVINGEITTLPEFLDSDKEAMFQAGYLAASEGKPESECPIMAAELVKCWMSGFRKWQEENDTDQEAA
jgi:ribosome modulation factor